jgi:hypothetical protein
MPEMGTEEIIIGALSLSLSLSLSLFVMYIKGTPVRKLGIQLGQPLTLLRSIVGRTSGIGSPGKTAHAVGKQRGSLLKVTALGWASPICPCPI